MAKPQNCSARTCSNQIGPSDQCFPFPSGTRGITWQELLLGMVNRNTGSLIVCSSHFSEKQFVRGRNGQLQLGKHALPDVNVLSSGNECRFCMEPSKINMYPLFTQHPEVPSLEDIERTVNIRIRPQDGLPELACATCMSKIRYIKRIQDQFQESDRKLRVRLGLTKTERPEPDEEPTMEEEYLVEKEAEQDNFLLTADQLTIVEGAQEEIETSETAREESVQEAPVKSEEQSEGVLLFSGDIQESTDNNGEYDMTELALAADSDDAANGNDSDETEQKNGNPYKPFRYSKRARRGD
uniref:Uncharacterized protein n=1 Tax=Culex tarsalis TaxID=7177 RepID=A0A1Q3F7C6_CULTA